MKRIILLCMTVAAVSLAACNDASKTGTTTTSSTDSSTAFNLSDARKAIEADNAKFIVDVQNQDSAALDEHYASDAQFLMPNAEPISKANMKAAMGGMLRMGIKGLKLNMTDLVGNNDLLAETGTYEMFADKNTKIDNGKYIVIWKKENGNWKIYRDMINTSMPMQQAK